MGDLELGRQLRARRAAAGRTVASVAVDAGLSVLYIANLENGRGNPTTTALARLAEALGMCLVITLVPNEEGQQGRTPASAEIPASLVRLGRTARLRGRSRQSPRRSIWTPTSFPPSSWPSWLALALAHAIARDLAEADWWRILDALLLIATHPAGS